MTCEIAIMNRQAVVLAADSATTVTNWVNGEKEERFYKGANKIFQISHHHPVGLMIFDSANLHNVPWEIILKDFRNYLGEKSFNELQGYADELFRFIANHSILFPASYQEDIFLNECEQVAQAFFALFAPKEEPIKLANSREERSEAYRAYFDRVRADLENEELPSAFNTEEVDLLRARHADGLQARLRAFVTTYSVDADVDVEQLTNLAITALIKRHRYAMSKTGIVIAGYGDHEYFPGFLHYECYGILGGKFLSRELSSQRITHEGGSYVQPFATTSMVETFWMGISPDLQSTLRNQNRACIERAIEKISAAIDVPIDPALTSTLVAEGDSEYYEAYKEQVLNSHVWPMSRVLSSLPIEEMAELAETLIMLESLKEKVTKPTSSVSGPTDVVVISKIDGFVWLKRKHYFDPALNPRFFARQSARIKS